VLHQRDHVAATEASAVEELLAAVDRKSIIPAIGWTWSNPFLADAP
jgi:hypothetical protein